MKFATITPDRGDRPELTSFCRHQLSRMNTKPGHAFFIDYPPISGDVDLVPRIKLGIEMARDKGYDLVFIIENDDYYPADYFDNLPDADFIGEEKTTYYNLRNNTHQEFTHYKRSSLFTTGFKISALGFGYRFPSPDYANLDVHLWQKAPCGGYIKAAGRGSIFIRKTGAIGIKHGIGLLGGRGHSMVMDQKDINSEWLRTHVDPEAYIFYKSLNISKI